MTDMTNEELADYLSAMAFPDSDPEDYSIMAEAAARLRQQSEDLERVCQLLGQTIALYEAGCDMDDMIGQFSAFASQARSNG